MVRISFDVRELSKNISRTRRRAIVPRECAPTKVSGISFVKRLLDLVEIWRRLTAHEATQRRPLKYAKGPIQVGVVSRLARASAQDRLRANEDFRPRLRGALSRSRRDLAIRAVAALNAHGAAHRRTRKYAKGPIQVGVVSHHTRVSGPPGVREPKISRRHGTSFASPE